MSARAYLSVSMSVPVPVHSCLQFMSSSHWKVSFWLPCDVIIML